MNNDRRLPQVSAVAIRYALLFAVSLGSAATTAAPGDPDPYFGRNGVVTVPANLGTAGRLSKLAVDRDNRLYVGLQFLNSYDVVDGFPQRYANYRAAVVRHRADGEIDNTFGTAGWQFLDPPVDQLDALRFSNVDALLPQPDGKLLVVGRGGKRDAADRNFTDPVALIQRLNADGSPDAAFGSNGQVVLPMVSRSYGLPVQLKVDGQGGLFGLIADNGFELDVRYFRLRADGRPDTTWADDGVRQLLSIPPGGVQAAQLLDDGRFDLIAYAGNHTWVLRFLSNGQPDPDHVTGDGYLPKEYSEYVAKAQVLPSGASLLLTRAQNGLGGASAADWAYYQPDGTLAARGRLEPNSRQDQLLDALSAPADRYYTLIKTFDLASPPTTKLNAWQLGGRTDYDFANRGTLALTELDSRYTPAASNGQLTLQPDGRKLAIAVYGNSKAGGPAYSLARVETDTAAPRVPGAGLPSRTRLTADWAGDTQLRLKASVSGQEGLRDGTVTFTIGLRPACTARLQNGSAECVATADLGSGADVVKASMQPDNSFAYGKSVDQRTLSALAGLPDNGWWWTPDQPGRGYFLETRGRRAHFVATYFGDDGSTRWATVEGPLRATGAGSWELRATWNEWQQTGGKITPTPRGEAVIGFTAGNRGRLQLNGQSLNVERFVFTTPLQRMMLAPQLQSDTGLWWDPATPGAAYAVELQGLTPNVAKLGFAAGGQPTWIAGAGTWYAAFADYLSPVGPGTNSYHLDLYGFSGGPTLLQPGSVLRSTGLQSWKLFSDPSTRAGTAVKGSDVFLMRRYEF